MYWTLRTWTGHAGTGQTQHSLPAAVMQRMHQHRIVVARGTPYNSGRATGHMPVVLASSCAGASEAVTKFNPATSAM